MNAEIKEKIKALVAVNEELTSENETLKKELETCVNAVKTVFGQIIDSKNQLNMQKVMSLIIKPGGIQEPIENLMKILEKYGATEKS